VRTFKYEAYQRQPGEHRPGQFGLLIEGLDAELTIDPAQFTAAGERYALSAQGLDAGLRQASFSDLLTRRREGAEDTFDPAKFAADVDAYCRMRAERALARRIERLQRGLPVDPKQQGISAGTGAELSRVARFDEAKSVETFLNRGHLCGLTQDERTQRLARKAQRHDCDADWLARRAKLIAECQAELAEWEAKLAEWEAYKAAQPLERRRLLLPPKAVKKVAMLRDRLQALSPKVLAATHGYQSAYAQYWTEGVQLATDDIRAWPLMTNTTADTERDGIDTFSELTTTDEFDGANYSAGGLALDSQAVAEDDANDRAEFDAADEVVTALGAGTRSIDGIALGLFSVNTAGSRILHWIEFAADKTPDGSDFTFVFNAEGILNAQDG
jgi:hypothetical protein